MSEKVSEFAKINEYLKKASTTLRNFGLSIMDIEKALIEKKKKK